MGERLKGRGRPTVQAQFPLARNPAAVAASRVSLSAKSLAVCSRRSSGRMAAFSSASEAVFCAVSPLRSSVYEPALPSSVDRPTSAFSPNRASSSRLISLRDLPDIRAPLLATNCHERAQGLRLRPAASFYFGVFASRKSRTLASSCSFVTSNTFSVYCFACDTELVDMET